MDAYAQPRGGLCKFIKLCTGTDSDRILAILGRFRKVRNSSRITSYDDFLTNSRMLADSPDYSSCAKDMHEFARWATNVVDKKQATIADAFLSSIKTLNYTKPIVNTTAAWSIRMELFEEVFSASVKNFRSTGFAGGLGYFCDNLKASKFTGDKMATAMDLADGIVTYYGLNRSIAIYASVIDDIITQLYNARQPAMDYGRLSKRTTQQIPGGLLVNDTLSWEWQTCFEAGKYTNSHLPPTNH